MKKLVFMFVAVAAISFASCGNKAQQAPVQQIQLLLLIQLSNQRTIERKKRPPDVSSAVFLFIVSLQSRSHSPGG